MNTRVNDLIAKCFDGQIDPAYPIAFGVEQSMDFWNFIQKKIYVVSSNDITLCYTFKD